MASGVATIDTVCVAVWNAKKKKTGVKDFRAESSSLFSQSAILPLGNPKNTQKEERKKPTEQTTIRLP